MVKGKEMDPVTFHTRYGSTDRELSLPEVLDITSPPPPSDEGTGTGTGSFVSVKVPKRLSWSYLYSRICRLVHSVIAVYFSISYIFAIIAMMVWSVVFPSWPSFIFLLWACVIWLIPKISPRLSMLYTSPLLVLYCVAMLLLQYVYSLDLGSRLNRNSGVVVVCDNGLAEGCKSWALLGQSVCGIVFFSAFREMVRLIILKWRRRGSMHGLHSTDGIGTTSPELDDPEHLQQRAHFYEGLRQLIATYWVLMVVGAFMLVFLTGDPSFLKTIYLVFFFFFMISYQITERCWFYINFPLWWLLIIYAVVDLILIYTYQFTVVREKWSHLYNNTGLQDKNITEMDLYTSIGFQRIDTNLKSLFESLIPPAIFIAVMALQLRYFKPSRRTRHPRTELETSYSAFDLSALVPNALRNAVMKLRGDEEEEEEEEEGEEGEGGGEAAMPETDTIGGIQVAGEETPRSKRKKNTLKRQQSLAALTPNQRRLYKLYKFSSFLFNKTRTLVVTAIELVWRFLELYLHKIVVITLFATCISQISVLYWFLLVGMVVFVVPLPYLNPLTYPLLTLYLGVVTIVKMIYQFPVISESYFNFPARDMSCMDREVVGPGEIFENRYAPQGSDPNWLGLHKASGFASYVSLPIISTLLLTLWFSARRYMKHFYHSKEVIVTETERGSLFLKVSRADADKSVWSAFKYLVNHIFEMYGVEICWCMLAITVAVRIDVYGIVYALALALLLLVPRGILFPVWIFYLVLHAVLLAIQYFFLLGRPPQYCFTGGDKVYPWSYFSGISVPPTGFKKWLFLPADTEQILDKNLLYADFLVYLLIALQAAYFRGYNPLRALSSQHYTYKAPTFLNFKYFLDYIKLFVFQYYLWVTLFLIFVTAVVRVSLVGMLYMLLVFYFMYRGRALFKYGVNSKHYWSWIILRWVSLGVLTLRVSIQIWNCVLDTSNNKCFVILLFNGACTKSDYYGVSTESVCDESNVGLWVDALNFIVITLQMSLFDTQYAAIIRDDTIRREAEATMFRDVFDAKVREKSLEAAERKKQELLELKGRASELGVTKHTVDHILHAGVQIPDDVVLKHSKELPGASMRKDNYFDILKLKSPDRTLKPAAPLPKTQEGGMEEEVEEEGKLSKLWKLIVKVVLLVMDDVTEWLESMSALYLEVVEAVKTGSSSEEASEEGEELEGGVATTGGVAGATGMGEPEGEEEREHTTVVTIEKAGESGGAVEFDRRGGLLEEKLHLEPTPQQRKETEDYEAELKDKANPFLSRLQRLITALYYLFLSNNRYIPFFFVILNIIINGSVLSLIYAVLLFGWGLMSVPWPSKRFWISLIFYTMFVLVVKYAFQFKEIEYWKEHFDPNSGLYPPRIIGIEKKDSFVSNAVVDILLLIFLVIHRGLLFQYGLWRSRFEFKLSTFSSDAVKEVKLFFKNLVDSNFTLGTGDYYVIMLFFDCLCLLTICFGVNSFGIGVPSDNVAAVAEYIQTNQIPIVFVIMLFLQFLSMLVDRAIYLRHSLWAKLFFQIFLLIVWHFSLFFILPSMSVTNRPFIDNAAAQTLYFFKACYFIVSALQIIAGYPTRVLSNFLATKYSTISWLAFNLYRVIPILPDLREVMDWVFTDTTLSLINWFKVQEIYAQLYLVKVQRNRERSFPRKLGEKQSLFIKALQGVLLLSALVLLIWGPLLVISFIGTTNQSNPPTQLSVQLNLAGFEPLVELTAQDISIQELDSSDYDALVTYLSENSPNVSVGPLIRQQLFREDFRRVTLAGNSTSLWVISPPARELLVEQLSNLRDNPGSDKFAQLDFDWTISREPSTGLAAETVSGSIQRRLRYANDSDQGTIDMFLDALNSSDPSTSIELQYLFPVLIQAPANGRSSNFSQYTQFLANDSVSYVTCNVELSHDPNGTSREWWALQQNISLNPYIVTTPTDGDQFLEIFIYSNRIAPPAFSAIAGIGIITLYVSVVLVIGRFIRSYIADLPTELLINEILYPEQLLSLCQDIFLVRESKDFRLEEILVGKLFYIMRSPDMVVKLTEEPKQKTD